MKAVVPVSEIKFSDLSSSILGKNISVFKEGKWCEGVLLETGDSIQSKGPLLKKRKFNMSENSTITFSDGSIMYFEAGKNNYNIQWVLLEDEQSV